MSANSYACELSHSTLNRIAAIAEDFDPVTADQKAMAALQFALHLIDDMMPDPDLEEGGDLEPSLGSDEWIDQTHWGTHVQRLDELEDENEHGDGAGWLQ